MRKKWKTIHKRKTLGEAYLEENRGIDIDKLDDRELGYAIKNELITWHNIKKWAEQKKSKKPK